MSQRPTKKELQEQVERYRSQVPHYKKYATALERVLGDACKSAIPERIVTSRVKTPASFAEKCVRKWNTKRDPINQFNDLCGARVIVHTLEQVEAVGAFLEHNFTVLSKEDKQWLLSEDQFGYRDVHFIVRLKADRHTLIGFKPEEVDVIGVRTAEIQVRSLLQHAWADILHDREYKAPLTLRRDDERAVALLAAIVEEGDRNFDVLAGRLDSMFANYSAYLNRADLENEIEVQELLLTHASGKEAEAAALCLARLIAGKGEWAKVIGLLEPHENAEGLDGASVRSELGRALCRLHRTTPASEPYKRGQSYLLRVIKACEEPDLAVVQNRCQTQCLHARALAWLGWSFEPLESDAHQARDCYRRAAEFEPTNPYHLADMLGFELKHAAGRDLVSGFRAAIRNARSTCHEHAKAKTELPAAFFIAGRLGMLLSDYCVALNDYACGIRHWLDAEGCRSCDFAEDEIKWLHRAYAGKELSQEYGWAVRALQAAQRVAPGSTRPAKGDLGGPILIVAGGAASLAPAQRGKVKEFLKCALEDYSGVVVSGGTTEGVPGCVGDAVREVRAAAIKRLRLIAYVPKPLPEGAQLCAEYECRASGSSVFSPTQVMDAWLDIIDSGVRPSDVTLLGWGGGPIAAFEYRIALALGAKVGVVMGSGGAVEELLADPHWSALPRLHPLPCDIRTVQAFVERDGPAWDPSVLETMAKEFHDRYRRSNARKVKPDVLKPWSDLPETYRKANLEQAASSIRILEMAGFVIRAAEGEPEIFGGFTDGDVELMAEMEHGRWNVERLRDGWRPGERDDAKKLHDCLKSWGELRDGEAGVKRFDRDAVRSFPEILAKAGLEVVRNERKSRS